MVIKKTEKVHSNNTQPGIDEQAAETTTALNPVLGFNRKDIVDSLTTTCYQVVKQPLVAVSHLLSFGVKLVDIAGGKTSYTPTKKDRRFVDETWQKNKAYRYLMQSYIAMQESLGEWVEDVDLSSIDERKAQFILKIITDSVAPTNLLLGNPAALKQARDTKGLSLAKGFIHFISDLKNNGGLPSQVDKSQFAVAKNLATTPGRVVFKNNILELIQYKPKTENVYSVPLLVVPPQINKFYVFDLTPEKSFFKYCLDANIQTFVISWKNPTPKNHDWGMDDYIKALKEAIDAMKFITKQDVINVMGACSGGITASVLTGYLDCLKDKSINSLTLSVCLLSQNEEDSEMSIFATKQRIEEARKASKKKGVLRGKDLARVFSWMRPNDLIWNYVVNNYLMGKKPPAFDILFWNGDTTNLPAHLHSDYLDIIAENSLAVPGKTKICNKPIDIRKSTCDKYIVAGTTDHITPWKACYRNTTLLGGDIKFILSSSGHIQSLINPPGNPRSKYFTNAKLADSAQLWLDDAKEQQGTWWDHWMLWLQQRSGEQKTAPKQLGNRKYKRGEPAPGEYVHEVSD